MNARTRIKQEIAQLADGLKSRRPLADDLRSLDAMLANILEANWDRLEGCACDTCKEQLERARKLGYGPEDK